MKVYLDNAATTPMDSEVVESMYEVMKNVYGNPSSVHAHGRQARSIIDRARKKVAELLNASPAEIFFTSGGTEANNMVLRKSVQDLHVARIITSPIEHHAVLHTAEELAAEGKVKLDLVKLDSLGRVDFDDLRNLLQTNDKTLVSLMHANNEVGTKLDLPKAALICQEAGAFFHSDAVQTMGHYPFDLAGTPIHFTNCAAHKFHGPKGVGFCYIRSDVRLHPFITGGAQERNMRAGTENIYGIVGLAKALEVAHRNMENDSAYIRSLKNYLMNGLREHIPGVEFTGDTSEDSLYTVLNVLFPATPDSDMLLFKLDIEGVSASGGSACSSGSNVGSHVIRALRGATDRPSIRFSFSKFNTREELDFTLSVLRNMFAEQEVHS
jgi:cysteine desulfurase